MPPPTRSDSQPPGGRAIEPSSGPMNAIWAACSDAWAVIAGVTLAPWLRLARKLICRTWPNAKEKPMNDPQGPMYSSAISHERRDRITSITERPLVRWLVRLSMNNAAPIAAIDSSTRYTAHTHCGDRLPTAAITSRPTIWIVATPMLPPPAFSPSAQPLSRCGENVFMLVIDNARLPPPSPAIPATTMKVVYDVPGWAMKYSVNAVGIANTSAENIVQLRPPNLATANV